MVLSGEPCLLVMAKVPIAGFAKTRLCPPATPAQAAAIAAACLLDTLDTVLGTGARAVVALTGDLGAAHCSAEVTHRLRRCRVIAQRGAELAERLANAHADTARLHPGAPVLQIGMDTPHLTTERLAKAAGALASDGIDAILGPATDGGWWALGLRDPANARLLRGVPMSTSDTGRLTVAALVARGLRVAALPELSDVDTMADARRVARLAPHGRFANTVAEVRSG